MSLSREEIVAELVKICGSDAVVTDKEVLEESTYDRFRKYEGYHKVFVNPLPAAVVFVENKKQVSEILRFCNANGVNVVPRTGHSATEG